MASRLRGCFVGILGGLLLAACGGGSTPAPGQTGGAGGGGDGGSGGTGGTEAVCGDGLREGAEGCDDGAGNSDTAPDACRTDCSPARCGDGVRDGGEACDDGNLAPDDGCSATCTEEATATCGDGQVQDGEACDDGNEDDTDACVACAAAVCGDGAVWADHEDCDDGNTTPGDGCSPTCEEESSCGDGLLDDGEACDDGNADDHDACRNDCTEARCGDGTIRAGVEACDDGPANSDSRGDACRTDCTLPGCGDGVIDTGEGCEDGNESTTDGCIACVVAVCGDGHVRAVVEECDAGPANSDTAPDSCRTDCRAPRCGDGVTDAGESCDDGNTVPTDGCNDCETPPVCGNGRREAGEVCDDGNVRAGDGCSTRCALETGSCGATIVDLNVAATPGPTGFTYAGTTVGAGDDSRGSCQAHAGAETVLAYFLNRRADLVLTTDAEGGARDTVIYARRDCADPATELGCDDDGAAPAGSLVLRDLPANTQLFLVVDDGADQPAPAPFSLTARIVSIGDAGAPCDPEGATSRCDAALFCHPGTLRCTAPVCGNGRTEADEECDDGGTADLDGCSARCRLEGETCSEPLIVTVAGGTATFSGDTTGARADYGAGCAPSGGNRDVVHSFTSPTTSRWTFRSAASFNTVLFARATCDQAATELGCANDASTPTGGDTLALDLLAGQTAFLFVDGYGTGSVVNQGAYSVTGTAVPLRLVGEGCDPAGAADVCEATAYCATGGSCVAHGCGDGLTWTGHEGCDDGNTVDGDGCSAACLREGDRCAAPAIAAWDAGAGQVVFSGDTGGAAPDYVAGCAVSVRSRDQVWSFTAPMHARYTFTAAAGFDTVLAAQTSCGSSSTNLACANSASGAGGDVLTVDLAQGQTVTLLVDGFDGVGVDAHGAYTVTGTAVPIRAVGEPCDLAGVADFCDAGLYCAEATSRCAAHVCGDGVVRATVEECDDGNTASYDGCSAGCRREGDTCGAPSLAAWDAGAGGVAFGGDTTALAGNYAAGCTATDTQPDAVWRFVPPFRGNYTFTVTEATFNTVLALQSSCGDAATNVACSNSSTSLAGGDTLTVELQQGQAVSILVDGANRTAGNRGTYAVVGTAVPIGAVGVACDPLGVASLCDVAAYCHPTTAVCTAHVCGDRRLHGTEQCDDGNTVRHDGCDPTCAFELAPELEPNGDPATATAAFRNGRNLGAIDTAGDVDLFRLNLTGANQVFDVWAQTGDGSGTTSGCPFDTTLELLAADGATVLASDADDGPGACSRIDPAVDAGARRLAAGSYFLKVRHASPTGTSPTPYVLDVRTTEIPVRATGSACDPTGATDVCVATARCDATARTCLAHACGDGHLWAGQEACDDGNLVSQDGCSATCAVEGDACAAVVALDVADGDVDPDVWTWAGNTLPLARDFDGASVTGLPGGASCPNTSGKRDAVASFTVPVDGSYRAELLTSPSWDSVLFATTECGGTVGLACKDAANFELHGLVAGQTLFLVVDGYGSTVSDTNAGAFTLKVTRRRCGDGVTTAQLGEVCDDGNAVDTDACVACQPASCGDGFVRAGVEACDDGNQVGGDGCSSHCVIEGGCGDHLVQAGETCDDGGAVDGDGCSATCQTEAGWTCPPDVSCAPICGDGLVLGGEQCDDPNSVPWDGCTGCRLDGDACASAIPLALVDTHPDPAVWTWSSTTTAFRADPGITAPCQDTSAGRDAIYAFTAPAAATYAFTLTATSWNPVLFAYDHTCGGAYVLACASAGGTGVAESFELPLAANQTIHLVVDGATSSANGLFTLRADRRYCGDGLLSVPEVCDAGPANSDTTPDACRLDCRPARCGDAVIDGGERCDDGNTADGDGCSATCVVAGLCGNAAVDAGETCDDGNAAAGDGCSLACTAEPGWSCAGNDCLPICGDGLLVGPEGCDDGNTVDGDGCDANCQCGTETTQTFAASIPTPLPIPDDDTVVGASASVVVAGLPGVIVDLDVAVAVRHTWSEDVILTLEAPDGRVLMLARDQFDDSDHCYDGTVFDDDANPVRHAERISSQGNVDATGAQTPLQPENSLGRLHGTSPNGTWTLHAYDDEGWVTGTLTAFFLAIRAASVAAGPPLTFTSTTALPIAESAPYTTSTIDVPMSVWGDVWDVRVTTNVTHPDGGQLDLFLVAPGGERYSLSTDNGAAAADVFAGTRFHENAAELASGAAYTSGTAKTELVPESSLSKLVGLPASGIWTLEVVDDTAGATGTLHGWTLELVPVTCDVTR